MADKNDDEKERDEASEEPRAKKFKYTSKAKSAPAKEAAVPPKAAEKKPARDDEDEDEDDEPVAKKPAPAKKPAAAKKEAADDEDDDEDADDEEDDADDEEDDEDADDDDEEAEAAEGDDEDEDKPVEVKENRAQRRKKKKVKEGAEPQDRNEKIRKQLLKKKLAAEEEPEELTAGEMVDDAFARGVAATGKWLQRNSVAVQYVLLAAMVGAVGFGIYSWRTGAKSEEASSLLSTAIHADRGVVDPDPPPMKPGDEPVVAVYKSQKERTDAAFAGYKRAANASNGTGAAILARLGEAGLLLDTKKWDEAAAAYREVKASPLAAADVDVRGRAVEGIGFALEGKGDQTAAMGAFKELETVTGRGFKELALYHQARIHASKGEKDRANELIKTARERIKTDPRGFTYLEAALDELGRSLDPNAGSKGGGPRPGGNNMGLEQLMKLQEMMQKNQGDE